MTREERTGDPSKVLAGLIERVTFHNAKKASAIISADEWITASGEWINDRAHGHQFKARFLKTSARRTSRAALFDQPPQSRIANTTIMVIAVSVTVGAIL